MFGPDAKLEVAGAFVVTTADELRLADGGRFAASVDPADSVLTTAAPTAFGFLGNQPAPIRVDGSTLRVSEGQSLTVIGGDLQVSHATLNAPAGSVTLVSTASAGQAVITPNDAVQPIDTSSFEQLGDIDITNGSTIQDNKPTDPSDAPTGGPVTIHSGNLTLDRSAIRSDTHGPTDGGDIQITVREDLFATRAEISTQTTATGQAGDISITAHDIRLDGTPAGNQATVDFHTLIGSGIASATLAAGDSGAIHLSVDDSLTLLRHAVIGTSTVSTGDAMAIEIHSGQVRLDAEYIESNEPAMFLTGIISQSRPFIGVDVGDSGDVEIHSDVFQIFRGAQVASPTFGLGDGGHIDIVTDDLVIDGQGFAPLSPVAESPLSFFPTGILSGTFSPDEGGSSGEISIRSTDISLSGVSVIASDTSGSGAGGNIAIAATNLRLMPRSNIAANSFGAGQGGDISVTAKDVLIDGGGTPLRFGPGQREVPIAVRRPDGEIEVIIGTAVTSITTTTLGFGNAGDTTIEADTVEIRNVAGMSASSIGSGDAGNIFIHARRLLISRGNSPYVSGINVATIGTGRGGSIQIDTGELMVTNGGLITTNTFGTSDGGDIQIAAGRIVMSDENTGRVTAIAAQTARSEDATTNTSIMGNGGRIQISTGQLEMGPRTLISAASVSSVGAGGQIEIVADSLLLDPVESFAEIQSASIGTGDTGAAGNVNVRVRGDALLVNGGAISTLAEDADAGEIQLLAGGSIKLRDSTLTGNAGGDGARISIDSTFLVLKDSVIDGQADGLPVFVTVDPETIFLQSQSQILSSAVSVPPELDLAGSVVTLPVSLLQTRVQLRPHCAEQFGRNPSRFVRPGRGGLPMAHEGWQPTIDLGGRRE